MTDPASVRKARGAFFTPAAITAYLAAWAIRAPTDRVFEPSCGEASFLLAAGERLCALGAPPDRLAQQLHGVEIHPASARQAARLLAERGLRASVAVADFFDRSPTAEFDAVIGNPPYVRYQSFAGEARARAARRPELAARLRFVRGEAEQLPFADAEFDALSFTYLLRYVDDPAATLRELARVVKPGGRIAMLEFAVPRATLPRLAWRAHTRLGLPALGRLVAPAWFEVGRFLGPNIEDFDAREPDLPGLWRGCGIEDVHELRPSFGAAVILWGTRAR